MAERELYRPRRWIPTRRFARAWWYVNGTPSFWQRHEGIEFDDPLHVPKDAIDHRMAYFNHVPRKLAKVIRLLVDEARDDEEIRYVGVAVVEDAGMAVGRKSIEAVYRAGLDERRRNLVLNAMYPIYRTGDFGKMGSPLPGPSFPLWDAPFWWHPVARARGRRRLRKYYESLQPELPLN